MTNFDDLNDWQYAVVNGDTVLGLADWLEHQAEAHTHSTRWEERVCEAEAEEAEHWRQGGLS